MEHRSDSSHSGLEDHISAAVSGKREQSMA